MKIVTPKLRLSTACLLVVIAALFCALAHGNLRHRREMESRTRHYDALLQFAASANLEKGRLEWLLREVERRAEAAEWLAEAAEEIIRSGPVGRTGRSE